MLLQVAQILNKKLNISDTSWDFIFEEENLSCTKDFTKKDVYTYNWDFSLKKWRKQEINISLTTTDSTASLGSLTW